LLYVAARGPALPLRETQTGPQQPGAVDPVCGDPNSTTIAADARFSRYNRPVRVSVPAQPLTVTADTLPASFDV
jgi:hypothetical protein